MSIGSLSGKKNVIIFLFFFTIVHSGDCHVESVIVDIYICIYIHYFLF